MNSFSPNKLRSSILQFIWLPKNVCIVSNETYTESHQVIWSSDTDLYWEPQIITGTYDGPKFNLRSNANKMTSKEGKQKGWSRILLATIRRFTFDLHLLPISWRTPIDKDGSRFVLSPSVFNSLLLEDDRLADTPNSIRKGKWQPN